MIKSIFKTLSLSVVTLAALGASASAGQSASHAPCTVNAEIDRGWEAQQRLVERREAERAAEGLAFPGAIVVPPFESFAPYRKDVPVIASAHKTAKVAARTVDDHASRR